jgi:microcystin-dependent protein
MQTTPRRGISYPDAARDDRADIALHLGNLAVPLDADALYNNGTDAARQVAAHQTGGGRFWWTTDTHILWYDDGTNWTNVGPYPGIPAGSTVPTGAVMDFAGAAAPTGYLICDGSAVSRSTFSGLFGVIGSTYGAGDGSTTFNVPDFRGRMAVGLASGGHPDVNALGNNDGTTLVNRRPKHSHANGLTISGAPSVGSLIVTGNPAIGSLSVVGTPALGTLTVSGSPGLGTLGVTGSPGVGSLSLPNHGHGIGDPGHQHGIPAVNGANTFGGGGNAGWQDGGIGYYDTVSGTGITVGNPTSLPGISGVPSAGSLAVNGAPSNGSLGVAGAPALGSLAVNGAPAVGSLGVGGAPAAGSLGVAGTIGQAGGSADSPSYIVTNKIIKT